MLNERIVAHRGFQRNYPENTLLAMTKAIENGAHFIEMDIQFTADKQPVVYHDLTMQRVSNCETLINQINLDEALSCPAYEPNRLGDKFSRETITPLTAIIELLQQTPSVNAFIELKSEAVELLGIEKTYQIIEHHLKAVAKQCIVISFHTAFITHVKQQSLFTTGVVAKTWADVTSNHYKQLKPDYVFCDKHIIPPQADLNKLPFYFVVYEVDDAEQAREWFSRGADLIETFDIAGVLADLGHKAL